MRKIVIKQVRGRGPVKNWYLKNRSFLTSFPDAKQPVTWVKLVPLSERTIIPVLDGVYLISYESDKLSSWTVPLRRINAPTARLGLMNIGKIL